MFFSKRNPSTLIEFFSLEIDFCGFNPATVRGICSNGQCICSNRSYTGDDCQMCRLTNSIHAGCVHIGPDSHPPCMCLSISIQSSKKPRICVQSWRMNGEKTGEFPAWSVSIHWRVRFFARSAMRSNDLAIESKSMFGEDYFSSRYVTRGTIHWFIIFKVKLVFVEREWIPKSNCVNKRTSRSLMIMIIQRSVRK